VRVPFDAAACRTQYSKVTAGCRPQPRIPPLPVRRRPCGARARVRGGHARRVTTAEQSAMDPAGDPHWRLEDILWDPRSMVREQCRAQRQAARKPPSSRAAWFVLRCYASPLPLTRRLVADRARARTAS
jgi:hypothetical protein